MSHEPCRGHNFVGSPFVGDNPQAPDHHGAVASKFALQHHLVQPHTREPFHTPPASLSSHVCDHHTKYPANHPSLTDESQSGDQRLVCPISVGSLLADLFLRPFAGTEGLVDLVPMGSWMMMVMGTTARLSLPSLGHLGSPGFCHFGAGMSVSERPTKWAPFRVTEFVNDVANDPHVPKHVRLAMFDGVVGSETGRTYLLDSFHHACGRPWRSNDLVQDVSGNCMRDCKLWNRETKPSVPSPTHTLTPTSALGHDTILHVLLTHATPLETQKARPRHDTS